MSVSVLVTFFILMGIWLTWYWIRWRIIKHHFKNLDLEQIAHERIMAQRFCYRPEIFSLPPHQVNEKAAQAMDAVSVFFEENQLTFAGEFYYFESKESIIFLRAYTLKPEGLIAALTGSLMGDNVILRLNFTTAFKDGTRIESDNEATVPYSIVPGVELRRYPDCMPGELLRLHREFVASHPKNKKIKPIPKNIARAFMKDLRHDQDKELTNGTYQKVSGGKFLQFTPKGASLFLESLKKQPDYSHATGFSSLYPDAPQIQNIDFNPEPREPGILIKILTVLYPIALAIFILF